jgi:two-component system CheB/CheR fusion protein
LDAYFQVLKLHSEEPRALYNDLLLNVTEFFRDADYYGTIERVLREILERKDVQDRRVRIWSIGCSTGEEAYSLAMLLIEHSAGRSEEPLLQVFASELSPDVLQQAREGVYPQEIAASISPDRLERFFVQDNGRYRVRRELRDMVIFANHDLFKDPPYSHLDLIVCRNLLRELQPPMRRGALNLFYYGLEPHGALVIDPHDDIEAADLFTLDEAQPGLLRRNSGPRRVPHLPSSIKAFARMSGERGGTPLLAERLDTPAIFRRAIEHYTPPSVLLNNCNHVVHFSVTAARYVRIPGGELTLDILELVPETIGRRLEEGLQRVRRGELSWESEPFVVLVDGRVRRLRLRIDRAGTQARTPELLLVVFDDAIESAAAEIADDRKLLDQVLKLQTELEAVHRQLIAHRRISGATAPGPEQQETEEQLRAVV